MQSREMEKESARDESPDRSQVSRLRLLDFDDLFLLGHLLEGRTIAATARQLGLTQPAITQRVRKIERVFSQTILVKVGRHVQLTPEGRAICGRAAGALALMREVTVVAQGDAVVIGASSLHAASLLWPVIAKLPKDEQMRIHIHVDSEAGLAARFELGELDAVLSQSVLQGERVQRLDLGEHEYVMVASPELAGEIRRVEDLEKHVLLELDKPMSLLAHIDLKDRSRMRFARVWFLGAPVQVVSAALQGSGVAVLPLGLVDSHLKAGRLVAILPEVECNAENLKISYRSGLAGTRQLDQLAGLMRRNP